MAQRKTERLLLCVEPTLYTLAKIYAGQLGMTTSEYLRSLMINDLQKVGVLTDELFKKMVV